MENCFAEISYCVLIYKKKKMFWPDLTVVFFFKLVLGVLFGLYIS